MPQITYSVVNNDNPAEHAEMATPSDTADLVPLPRALYVGVGGDIAIQTLNGTTVPFVGFAGGFFPVRVKRLLATGTTAASIIALY
jgi:hypothetical protein